MTSHHTARDSAGVSNDRFTPRSGGCVCLCCPAKQPRPDAASSPRGGGGADAPVVPPAPAPSAEHDDGGPVLLLTVEQAARVLGLGRTTTYRLITSGALGSVRIGNCRRVPTSLVHAFVTDLLCAGNRALLDT